jgi:hypothetical protein
VLDELLLFARRRNEPFAFLRIVRARFLHVDILARLQREDRGWAVPVIGSRDQDRVERLVLKQFAKVLFTSRLLAPDFAATSRCTGARFLSSTSQTAATSTLESEARVAARPDPRPGWPLALREQPITAM